MTDTEQDVLSAVSWAADVHLSPFHRQLSPSDPGPARAHRFGGTPEDFERVADTTLTVLGRFAAFLQSSGHAEAANLHGWLAEARKHLEHRPTTFHQSSHPVLTQTPAFAGRTASSDSDSVADTETLSELPIPYGDGNLVPIAVR